MEKTVQELKIIIRELLLEVGELKERLTYLEQEVFRGNNQIEESRTSFSPVLEGETYDRLGKIYNEGYHVCPMAYGQVRDGECLFCIAFLEKE